MQVPSFLASFDLKALHASSATLVALTDGGLIAWTNPAWSRFAMANGGQDVLRRFGVGSSYFVGISEELRPSYQQAFTKALQTGTPFKQDYECSSGGVPIVYHLRALPLRGGLLLEHSPVVDLTSAFPTALESFYRDAHGFVRQCSICRRVRRPDSTGWDWVSVWRRRSPPRTSHGLCKICVGLYWSEH